jgi:hypothetical protein
MRPMTTLKNIFVDVSKMKTTHRQILQCNIYTGGAKHTIFEQALKQIITTTPYYYVVDVPHEDLISHHSTLP